MSLDCLDTDISPTEAFFDTLAALGEAEAASDEDAVRRLLRALLASAEAAPDAWKSPFAADDFCRQRLLAKCPAAFWRRLARRFPNCRDEVGATASALADEDLLDLAPPETTRLRLGESVELELVEGSYATGGIGRHVYAAAVALGTLLAQGRGDVGGKRVLELGCGLGVVGLAAARCGAASVLMTDYAAASVECATSNAARNGFGVSVRAAQLDWRAFDTAAGGDAACAAAGVGVDGWWPDVIIAADVCYSEEMGDAVVQTLAHLLARAPADARALVLNGWPNRGLARLETLLGARDSLSAQERTARDAGEPAPPRRPFVDGEGGREPTIESDGGRPRGLSSLELLAAERMTGFAEHAHHLYVLAAAGGTQGGGG
jgi:predicted nicotinamide N-methyase